MAENVLLVPIGVEALVVNRADQLNTTWSIGHKNYSGLINYEPLEPPPFTRGNDWPRLGVTLHWALPDGLTRGEEKDGKLVFPYIPNRWLVVRTVIQPNDPTQPNHPAQAWIVESDYLGPDGSNLYPDPQTKSRSATRIGRCFEIKAWPGEASRQEPHLTAVGPGDITFTAYIANLDNVLSFYDSLEDLKLVNLQEDRPATLSYLVVGWYAQPEADPLAFGGAGGWQTSAEWTEKMTRFKWSLGNEADLARAVVDMNGEPTGDARKDYPSRTVCHGLVSGVNWTGRYNGAAQTGPLSRKNRAAARGQENGREPQRAELPHIAIGNSAIDALAALLEYLLEKENDPLDISTFIQALEYDLVNTYDQPGGQIELAQQIHQQWFTSSPGGKGWQVVAAQKEAAPDQDSLAGADAAVQLSDAQASRLDELNKAQAELDQAERQLHSRQWELYALWWKSVRLPHLSDKNVGINLGELINKRDTLKEEINADLDLVADLRKRCDTLWNELELSLRGGARQDLQIKENSAPRFYRPTDPVVLLYGLQRSAKHGEDGRFTSDDTLFVRFNGQTMRAFKPSADEGNLVNAASLDPAIQQPVKDHVERGRLPAVIHDLMVEALLLDMAQAKRLAELAGIEEAEMRRRQGMIWGDYSQLAVSIAAMTHTAGFTGVRPSPIAVEPWQPPWSPLFFCWRVSWYPTARDPKQALDDWSFNGSDYDWQGNALISHEQALTLQGRTLLSKTGTRALQDSLAALLRQVKEQGKTEAENNILIERLKQALESADLLSQPMIGFNDQLIQRDPLQFYDPDQGIAELIGGAVRAAPMPYRNGATESHFYPIRAGHFRLQRLWVVDAFGQVFDPIHERGQTPASFTPLRGSGLVTTGPKQRSDTQALQLPPRLVQSSRLQFRFMDAETPGTASNPVAGWLLANHFDNAIIVYDPAGRAVGTLLLVGSAQETSLRWDPIPMEERVEAAQIPNPHMRSFVQGLLEQGAGGFSDLLAAIDRTLWTTDPLGRRKDNLSLLLGRPLALVRASLELQLEGEPASDQLWQSTGKKVTKGFTNVRFPIQLGDIDLREDGMLGYFMGQDYSTFNTMLPRPAQASSEYIQNQFLDLSAASPQTVTLLVDPRGSIHARSGILPTKVIRLPARYVDRPLAEMDVSFRVGPVLNVNDARGMRMPLPADIQGGWSWIAQTGVDLWDEYPITPASHQANLGDKPVYLREGWLKLSDALGAEIKNAEDAD